MKNNKILAAWQQLASPQVTVAMASLGFDWVVVDLEHASITLQEAESIFIASERCGAKPFVRLPFADPYLARRLLDAGAVGLIVPVVESKELFDNFSKHCFFPPIGKRGLGLVRANGWGDHLQEYFDKFKPIIIAQIETKLAVDNIYSILSSDFLDGIMIGPYDLSASLGKPRQFYDPTFKELCRLVRKEAKNKKKLVGFHQVEPNQKALELLMQKEYDFIAYGTDIVALKYSLKGAKL